MSIVWKELGSAKNLEIVNKSFSGKPYDTIRVSQKEGYVLKNIIVETSVIYGVKNYSYESITVSYLKNIGDYNFSIYVSGADSVTGNYYAVYESI